MRPHRLLKFFFKTPSIWQFSIRLCGSGIVQLRLNNWIEVSFCLPQKVHCSLATGLPVDVSNGYYRQFLHKQLTVKLQLSSPWVLRYPKYPAKMWLANVYTRIQRKLKKNKGKSLKICKTTKCQPMPRTELTPVIDTDTLPLQLFSIPFLLEIISYVENGTQLLHCHLSPLLPGPAAHPVLPTFPQLYVFCIKAQ